MKKYSVISVDSNHNYLFLAPISARCWRKIGYDPIIILVSDGVSQHNKSLLKETAKCKILEVDKISNFRTCNIAQISRLFVSICNFFQENDYVIYGDADMLPLSERWFNQQDWDKKIHLFDAEELNYTRHKMCYIGAKIKKWRQLFNLRPEKLFNDYVKEHLESFVGEDIDWSGGWNYDEKFLFECLKKDPDYPSQCQMIVRGHNRFGGRNYRVDKVEALWKTLMLEYLTSHIIDIHVPQKSYEGEIWEDLKIMLRNLFNKDEIEFFEEYKENFISLLEQ